MILNEKLDEILKETMQVICTNQHLSNLVNPLKGTRGHGPVERERGREGEGESESGK